MTTEMMMIMRFIERNMEENMSMAVAMYKDGNYVTGHTYIERVCTYGHARKILLNGGTKEDIQKLADEYFDTGNSHIWFTYNEVAKEISSIEQFIKCGLYKTNAEREAENQQWIPVSKRLPDKTCYCLISNEYGNVCCDVYYAGDGFFDKEKVVAWMPLPKPAKFE